MYWEPDGLLRCRKFVPVSQRLVYETCSSRAREYKYIYLYTYSHGSSVVDNQLARPVEQQIILPLTPMLGRLLVPDSVSG